MPLPPAYAISPELRRRLIAWNRTWQTALDPVSEMRWPDPELGRRWMGEGEQLVRDLQAELGPAVQVIGAFDDYDPDAAASGS